MTKSRKISAFNLENRWQPCRVVRTIAKFRVVPAVSFICFYAKRVSNNNF